MVTRLQIMFSCLCLLLLSTHYRKMIFIGVRNLALSMLCNVTPPVGLFFHRSNLYNLIEKLEQPGNVGVWPESYSYFAILISN